MPIISVRDNENNRWKKNAQKNKDSRGKGVEATVKEWEQNDFLMRLSKVFFN